MQAAGPVGVGSGVHHRDRLLGVAHRPPAVTGLHRDLGDLREQVDEVGDVGHVDTSVDPRPQVDGQLELALRLGEGVQASRPPCRPQQRREGPDGLLGAEQVVGQLGIDALHAGGREGRVGLEGLGDRTVQPQPLAREQVGVHGFLQQRVPEAVAVAVGDQRLVLDGGA